MSKLVKLFEAREEVLTISTEAIFEQLSNATQGIEKYLELGEQLSGGSLTWDEAVFLEALEGESDPVGYIILSGIIAHDPGQSFTLPTGRVITVTEATAPYFRRMLRIGIPHKIASEGSVDDVVQFMQEVEKELPARTDLSDEMLDMVSSPETAQFDLDDLSEEQRQMLRYAITPGTKN